MVSLFFAMLCLGLTVGFLLQLPVDLGATKGLQQNLKASYIAEAAIQDTMAWMSDRIANSYEPCTPGDRTPLRRGELDGYRWTCLVEPDSGTPPNDLSSLRIYRLTAEVRWEDRPVYQTVATVQAGQSFARFTMFIEESGTITYDFLVTPDSEVRGPVHKNRPISFLVSPELLESTGSRPSRFPFDSVISTTHSDHRWYVNGSSSHVPHLHDDQYSNFLRNGVADLEFGVAQRDMPSDSEILARAAWGGTPSLSGTQGVTVNPMGGVFIEGDVQSMRLSVDPSDRFVLEISQSEGVSRVVEDFSSEERILTRPDGTEVHVGGLGTGVIYSTGSIQSLEGTNRGAHTIATRFEDGADIEITGSLLRADTPWRQEPTGNRDRLGLVGSHVYVTDEARLPRSFSTPLLIYATVMATERFEVRNRTSGNPGAMAIYGGMTSRLSWATVGFYSLSDLRTKHGYGGLEGTGSANIYYDKRLADEPPPEYPSTAASELKVRSWRETPL